jgi:hypothetical protein
MAEVREDAAVPPVDGAQQGALLHNPRRAPGGKGLWGRKAGRQGVWEAGREAGGVKAGDARQGGERERKEKVWSLLGVNVRARWRGT